MDKSKAKKEFLRKIYVKKYKEKKRQEFINKKVVTEYENKSYVNVMDRIINNLATRTNNELKKKNVKRTLKYSEILGCDKEFLKEHLRKNFKEKMSFNNYGKWHIDHIIPISSFNLEKKEELLKCFNYKNLQPLWAKENLVKSNKIIVPEFIDN